MSRRPNTNELARQYRLLLDALPQHWSVRQAARAAYLPYRKAMRILKKLGYHFELLDPKGTPVLGVHARREVRAVQSEYEPNEALDE